VMLLLSVTGKHLGMPWILQFIVPTGNRHTVNIGVRKKSS
jgi:hypothetical protein